jgi:glycyl-tRNA synthetase alpha chain
MNFQQLLLAIQQFWAGRGCVVQQPYDLEIGAGTMHPDTFFRVLGPEPWRVAFCQPSRRPVDGRFAQNPMRVYKHFQFQVILKPAPLDVQEQYLDSLRAFGVDPLEHDIRFEEDNWESPTLGAAGVGWQVVMDGMEISQFTYFQQAGGQELAPISVELTYGIERICMYLNDIRNVFDIPWNDELSYGDVRRFEEIEHSEYSFNGAPVELFREQFDQWAGEALRLLDRVEPGAANADATGAEGTGQRGLVLPAYEATLKCSHLFNVLDARGAFSVTERAATIQRIRRLACRCAEAYLEQRRADGFPLLASSPEQSGER